MGLAPGFFRELEKFLAPVPGLKWMDIPGGDKPIFTLSATRTKITQTQYKPVAVIIDAPGWVYKTWSSENRRPSETIEDLANVFAEKLKNYLTNPDITMVLFLFDHATPAAKSVSRKAGENTPHTPFELVGDSFVGTNDQKASAAWRIKLSRGVDNGDRKGVLLSSLDGTDSRHYRLPTPAKSELPPEKRTEYTYEECLRNKHFKKWLCKELCRVLLDIVTVPSHNTLIISGPDMCIRKTHETIDSPEEVFNYNYMEVDNAVGYFSHVLAPTHDVDIESEDGDCIITSLLGSHLRISGNTHGLLDLGDVFVNRVRIIRNQWSRNKNGKIPVAITDINNLYITLHYAHGVMSSTEKIAIQNPIGNFAMVALAGGCDYVSGQMLPGVGPTTLLKTYFTHFPMFAQRLVSNHIAKPSKVTLDVEAFSRFVVCCFRNAKGKTQLNLPIDDIARTLQVLRDTDTRTKGVAYPSVNTIRVLAGNLMWTLSYFAVGSIREVEAPDCCSSVDNLPIYGYASTVSGKTAHGFDNVVHAEDGNARYLHAKHFQKTQVQPERWLDNTLDDLQT